MQNFITSEQLKSIAAISDSIETKLLEPFIMTTQEMTVIPILGTALSTEISNQLLSGTTSLSNQSLIDNYILPFLAYATWSQAAPFLGIKAMKNALVKTASPNSESLSDDSIRYYKANIDNMANFYKDRLYNFLEADADLKTLIYPLYRSTNSEYKGSGSPAAGFFFKNRNRNNCDYKDSHR
jgi:hypothetical protein